jgi:lipopolysaccharide transport system permease protein
MSASPAEAGALVEPARRHRLASTVREMFSELVQYRELLYFLARRDIILRYKQSVMGIGWAVLMPLGNMLLFSLIFTRVAPIETDLPYPIYAYAGLLPWNLFASSLKFSVSSLTSNTALVTKVYFPRELLPFGAIIVSLVDFAVASVVLVALMVYYGIGVTTTVLFLPVLLFVQLAFTAGVALIVAMANLFFRDVKYLFEFVLTFWMFATAVVYPIDRVGGTIGKVLALNPMTPIIEGYRAVILRGEMPETMPFVWAAVLSVILLSVGWTTFHQAEFKFAERI